MSESAYLVAVLPSGFSRATARGSLHVTLPVDASPLLDVDRDEWYYDVVYGDVRTPSKSLRAILGLGHPSNVPDGVSFLSRQKNPQMTL